VCEGCPLAYVRHESCESTIVRVTVGRATHCRAVGEHRTAAKAAVPLPITAMPTSAGAAFNRSFAKSGIGGMLFGPNGPEHEAHLLSARVAIRFSLPHTTVTATAQQTLDATRHYATYIAISLRSPSRSMRWVGGSASPSHQEPKGFGQILCANRRQ